MISMKLYSFFLLFLISVPLVIAGGKTEKASVLIFNAASTTDLVEDLILEFNGRESGAIGANPASSGTLARQLEQGAEAQIFISASEKWMNYVIDLGIVEKSELFLANSLVLIAPADTPEKTPPIDFALDLPRRFEGRLSIGDPEHVPAGNYARQALEYFHWYDILMDRFLPAANARDALSVVELGEVELGIVYATDAMKSSRVKKVGTIPPESHSRIGYYCALLKHSTPQAEQFYYFLIQSDEAARLFDKHGFTKGEY